MHKNGLDEMQLQRKNKIGNQAFLMLMYLLLLDAGAQAYGFKWLDYPANVMAILTFCGGVYVIRLIFGNAYIGPSAPKRSVAMTALWIVCAAVLASAAAILLPKIAGGGASVRDNSALVLFSASTGALVAVAVAAAVRAARNRNDRE